MNTLAAKNCHTEGREKKCTCIKFLSQEQHRATAENVAEYMVDWAALPRREKKELINFWVRLASIGRKNVSRQFILPECASESGERYGEFICGPALYSILNIGRRFLESAKNNPQKTHGKVGMKGSDSSRGRAFAEVHKSLKVFFAELSLKEMLPPKISIRRCYRDWCYERGWVVEWKDSSKGSYVDLGKIRKRTTGPEPEKIIGWRAFWSYWSMRRRIIETKNAVSANNDDETDNSFIQDAAFWRQMDGDAVADNLTEL